MAGIAAAYDAFMEGEQAAYDAYLAEQDREAMTAWAGDEGLDPADPATAEAWTQYIVARDEAAAEDQEWRRGCGL